MHNVCRSLNDDHKPLRYPQDMARRGIPKNKVNWFLRDWMDHLGLKQADMVRLAGWSPATANQLYNGTQDYSPRVVNAAAVALNCDPYELLMPYETAMALRRQRADALKIVADTRLHFRAQDEAA